MGEGALWQRSGRVNRYLCDSCGYAYDEALGHPREGFPAGTPWSEIPEDWVCPDCGVRDKLDFRLAAGEETDGQGPSGDRHG